MATLHRNKFKLNTELSLISFKVLTPQQEPSAKLQCGIKHMALSVSNVRLLLPKPENFLSLNGLAQKKADLGW